jgi:hypothetical protein
MPEFVSTRYGTGIYYNGKIACEHTCAQIKKLKNRGIRIISYYISDSTVPPENSVAKSMFKSMYGKDANFINVSNIEEIANTLNNKFLSKKDE